jgi:hypothetical protein
MIEGVVMCFGVIRMETIDGGLAERVDDRGSPAKTAYVGRGTGSTRNSKKATETFGSQ